MIPRAGFAVTPPPRGAALAAGWSPFRGALK
jgi:hypothetical protein